MVWLTACRVTAVTLFRQKGTKLSLFNAANLSSQAAPKTCVDASHRHTSLSRLQSSQAPVA